MKIHLSQAGQESGPYTEAEIRAQLTSAQISPTDLARFEGQTEWQSVESLLQNLSATSSEPPAQPPKGISGCTAIGCAVFGFFVLSVLCALLVPTYNQLNAQANQMKAVANCRQIIGLLLAYAEDNNALYPDSVANAVTGQLPLTSNDAFRSLFQEGLTTEERPFGCPASAFVPNQKIGVDPFFDQALLPGENHWAMTKGLSTKSVAIMPLVFENPIVPSWPPRWNADANGKPLQGRAWPGGRIVVGNNDGSIDIVRLQSSQGPAVGPRMLGNGVNIFTQASGGTPQQILNIAVPTP